MPANLPPQYFEAEKLYRAARTPAEKIEALEAMLAIMPKHKGTDHLRAQLRARIASATQEAQRGSGGGSRAELHAVPKEGAGQVALVGPPNAGKSQLLAALTDAHPKVADYPFTTQLPQPAMLLVDNVHIQIVDLPPLTVGATPGWLRALVRQADLLLLVVNLADDPLADWALIESELAAMRLQVVPPGAPTGDDEPGWTVRPALVVATKADLPGTPEMLELLHLEIGDRLPVLAVSGVTGLGLAELGRQALAVLDVIRVYPRPPGKPVDRSKPFVLARGSTIDDLADLIHHDLRRKLKHALLWGASGKFGGQRVGRQHVLEDEDIVELIAE